VFLIRVDDDDDENDTDTDTDEITKRRQRRRSSSSSSSSSSSRATTNVGDNKQLPEQYDKVNNPTLAKEAKQKMFDVLRESASWDPDVEKLLDGIDASDPDQIEEAIRKRFEEKSAGVYKPIDGSDAERSSTGSETPTLVSFKNVITQNLWVWIEARNLIEDKEKEFIDEALKSWFVCGKLGGFSTENQQCLENAISLNETSYFDYDVQRSHDRTNASLFHAMGEVEYRTKWARVWMDLGTADEMALDVLINALLTLSREYVGLKQIIIGGTIENGWDTKDSGYGEDGLNDEFDIDDMFGDMRGLRGKPNEEDSKWRSR